jgi:hypothetical protein
MTEEFGIKGNIAEKKTSWNVYPDKNNRKHKRTNEGTFGVNEVFNKATKPNGYLRYEFNLDIGVLFLRKNKTRSEQR